MGKGVAAPNFFKNIYIKNKKIRGDIGSFGYN